MSKTSAATQILDGLNAEQSAAVRHGSEPLLIIAGAGTGKTRTLVHRVAHAIALGADPRRILLLTFTRRASAEMLRRVDALLRQLEGAGTTRGRMAVSGREIWGGTFHAIASRLLRVHGKAIGLDPGFTIQDRGDSEDLMDVVRTDLGLAKTDKRFPKKRTCMAIYSHVVNAQSTLEEILTRSYPWCTAYAADLKALFRGFVDRKESAAVLDYDDLLLFWHGLLADGEASKRVRERFDQVYVDEYQDTNLLQAELLRLLVPDGKGLTVVGDDAQSIYSFRAATVRNILDFPKHFPASRVIKLEQNYRSTPPILLATNGVIGQARERFTKNLWSQREGEQKPVLVTCEDENVQAEFIVRQVLEHREAGAQLRDQAVLFRASHHSIVLEAELSRCNIPFVKYGGLKFLEAAHVKDLMAFLRLAENPRDLVAGARVLMLLPGIGPKTARGLTDRLSVHGFDGWKTAKVPPAATKQWPTLIALMKRISSSATPVPAQVNAVLKFYTPLLEEKYDNPAPRRRDIEQLEQLAGRFKDRKTMLSDLTLDPPASTEDLAGPPSIDEDFLILSTIHSSKGLEWDAVYTIHASDGNIPSDMATGSDEEIDEERRLFYVALTRARNWLYVCFPQRYYHANRNEFSDGHTFAQLTRFITRSVKKAFELRVQTSGYTLDDDPDDGYSPSVSRNIRRRSRAMWS